jgi:hypothetical protein
MLAMRLFICVYLSAGFFLSEASSTAKPTLVIDVGDSEDLDSEFKALASSVSWTARKSFFKSPISGKMKLKIRPVDNLPKELMHLMPHEWNGDGVEKLYSAYSEELVFISSLRRYGRLTPSDIYSEIQRLLPSSSWTVAKVEARLRMFHACLVAPKWFISLLQRHANNGLTNIDHQHLNNELLTMARSVGQSVDKEKEMLFTLNEWLVNCFSVQGLNDSPPCIEVIFESEQGDRQAVALTAPQIQKYLVRLEQEEALAVEGAQIMRGEETFDNDPDILAALESLLDDSEPSQVTTSASPDEFLDVQTTLKRAVGRPKKRSTKRPTNDEQPGTREPEFLFEKLDDDDDDMKALLESLVDDESSLTMSLDSNPSIGVKRKAKAPNKESKKAVYPPSKQSAVRSVRWHVLHSLLLFSRSTDAENTARINQALGDSRSISIDQYSVIKAEITGPWRQVSWYHRTLYNYARNPGPVNSASRDIIRASDPRSEKIWSKYCIEALLIFEQTKKGWRPCIPEDGYVRLTRKAIVAFLKDELRHESNQSNIELS